MHSDKINIYDFDGTIYNGDSSFDFFLYCLKKYKKNILLLPKIFIYFLLYLFKIIKIEKFKSIVFSFMSTIDNSEKIIEEFWDSHEKNININLKQIIDLDKCAVIVSASPKFLIEPIGRRLNVKKVIASNCDIKTGAWIDDNCSGKNKIKYLNREYKEYSILNSYGNSYNDRYVALESDNAYLVYNRNISNYDIKKIELEQKGKEANILALIFMILFFVIGMIVNYNYDIYKSNNFFFNGDCKRVYNDFLMIFENHYRINVHPLILLFEPIIFVIKALTHNNVVALVLFNSIIIYISIKYLYKTISLVNKNKLICIILTLIYGFSFSTLIFSTTFENYSLSSLFFILFWYLIIKDIHIENKINSYFYIGLGVILTGILITNITVFIVGLIVLLFLKKISFKNFILINVCVLICIFSLKSFQKKVWRLPAFVNISMSENFKTEETKYLDYSINLEKFENVGNDIYMNGLISKNVYVDTNNSKSNYDYENYYLKFNRKYYIQDFIFVIFYLILFINIIKNSKDKKSIFLNLGLISSLGGLSILHLIYGNESPFLYSQNFIYIIILLFGINYKEKNKYINIFLFLFLLYEIINNFVVYKNILCLVNKYFKKRVILLMYGFNKEIVLFTFIIIFTILILALIIYLIKKLAITKNVNYIIIVIILISFLSYIFINLESINRIRVANDNNDINQISE